MTRIGCRHLAGSFPDPKCARGFDPNAFGKAISNAPCYGGATTGCAGYEPWTDSEQVAAECERLMLAARSDWIWSQVSPRVKPLEWGESGVMACPACGASLSYGRSELNGHMWAGCKRSCFGMRQ